MTTYQTLAEKTNTTPEAVRIVAARMGIKHKLTTAQLKKLEKNLCQVYNVAIAFYYNDSIKGDFATMLKQVAEIYEVDR